MKTSLDCLPCFIRQTLDAARMASGDPVIHEKIVREVLIWISQAALHESPPAIAQRIHQRLRELTGEKDPYREAKDRHNRMAARLVPKMRAAIEASQDPLTLAVRSAVAANIIDMGAKSGLTEAEVLSSLRQAAHEPIIGDMEYFKASVAGAREILYLTDNAGEIFFDRLLIEQLSPGKVTVAVRGAPIINDATLSDALAAGLDRICTVIDNGSDAPGTILADCSAAFRHCFSQADLIIAKGQGNFETLSNEPDNIFFLFKAKCPVVATQIGLPVGTHVLDHARGRKPKGVSGTDENS